MEDGFIEAVAEVETGSSLGAQQRLLDVARQVEELVHDEKALEERFEYYDRQGDENIASTDSVPAQGLQPSLQDPKMWMVRTKPGKEKEAILHLMNRFFLKRELEEPMYIFSATAPEHTPGYIYVEAMKAESVRAAVHGVPNVFSFKSTIVPVNQMTDVLRVSADVTEARVGQWVRVKRGNYQGDLGKVVSIDTGGQKLEIKLIPRIDLSEAANEEAAKKKRGRKKTDLGNRPKQRPFSADEMTAENQAVRIDAFDHTTKTQFYLWNDMRFDDQGYMYKMWNVKSLQLQDVQPTLDELQLFHARSLAADSHRTDEEKLVDLAKEVNVGRSMRTNLMKGDTVRVIDGAEKGLTGTVKGVTDKIVTVLLDSGYDGGDQLVEQYEVHRVEKHFNVGDHVKVLAGEHKDETGDVSKVMNGVVWVVHDSSRETFKVLQTDVQKSVSVAKGLLKLGNFSLHDLVRINDARTVGVIVKIEKDQFRVLDQNGEVLAIPEAAMGPKVHQRDPMSFDKQHASVAQGDLLKVVEGPHKGKQGKVIHIYRFYAFLECREVVENSGIINVKTDHCILLGSQARRRRDTNFSALGPNPLMSPGNLKQQMGGALPQVVTRVYSKSKKKDDMIGKSGVITRGPNKAHKGIVRAANDESLTVVLEATRRAVRVKREDFRAEGQVSSAPRYQESSLAGGFGFGWQTPSHTSMQTPMRPQTPGGVMGTPLRGDDDAVWNPMHQTPGHQTQWNTNDDVGMDSNAVMGGSSVDPDSRGWTPSSHSDYGTAYASSTYTQYGAPASSPYDPLTPGLYGSQPTPMSAYTPSAYATPALAPSPYVSAGGASPGMPMNSPYVGGAAGLSTPYSMGGGGANPFSTPRVQTPGHGGLAPQTPSSSNERTSYWHQLNAVVRLQSGEMGIICAVPPDGTSPVTVQIAGTAERRGVLRHLIEPVRPVVSDRTLIVGGENSGLRGEVIAFNGENEALVKRTDTGQMLLVLPALLCKLVE